MFPLTTLITGSKVIPAGNNLRHYVCALPNIDGTGQKISSMLMCRVYRNGTAAGDTYEASAGLLEIDFHFKMCGTASTQEYVK